MSISKPKVCAVIVTYNKPSYLRRCLNEFIKQDVFPQQLLVWDNASENETKEICLDFIKSFQNSSPGISKKMVIKYHRSEINLGGAGGFSGGVTYAMENDFDYVWLMDDDGYPEKSALRRLLEVSNKETVLNPLVVSDDDKETLSFFRKKGKLFSRSSIKTVFIENKIAPFNGTLIPLNVVRRIGNIDSRYFIWGDEMEFTLRLHKNRVGVKTLVNSLHFHPINKKTSLMRLGLFGEIREINNKYFEYIYYRNRYDYTLKYMTSIVGLLRLLKLISDTTLNILFSVIKRPLSVRWIILGLIHGLTHNFSLTYDKFISSRTS